jgi:hypothetical protein
MAPQYYTEELTAIPFRTLKQGLSSAAPSPLAAVLAAWFRLRGLLHWPLEATCGTGGPETGEVVPREALPPRALSRWAPILEHLGDLGFSALRYTIGDTIGQKQQVVGLFLDEPGTTIATLNWIRMPGAEGPIEKTPLEFNSYAADDPEIMTGCLSREELHLADLLRLPFVDPLLLPDTLGIRAVYRRHRTRIAGRAWHHLTLDSALREHRTRNERRFQWTLERGLMRPLTAAEIDRLRSTRFE